MTTTGAVICVVVAFVAFALATECVFRVASLAVFGVGTSLGVIACLTLRLLAPHTPRWLALVVALGSLPVLLVAVSLWGLLVPDKPPQRIPPVGACRRCGTDLWDYAGKQRYTDLDHSYLCPPEFWQPGHHRLHHLTASQPTTATTAPAQR